MAIISWRRANLACMIGYGNKKTWHVIGMSTSRSSGANMAFFVESVDTRKMPSFEESVARYTEARNAAYRAWDHPPYSSRDKNYSDWKARAKWYSEHFYYRQRDAMAFAQEQESINGTN